MPNLTVTTNDGIVVRQISLDDWDLTKPLARQALIIEIHDAQTYAETLEAKDEERDEN